MMIDLSDPVVFTIAMIFIGIALAGFFFFAREVVASGMELYEQRKHEREQRERREKFK